MHSGVAAKHTAAPASGAGRTITAVATDSDRAGAGAGTSAGADAAAGGGNAKGQAQSGPQRLDAEALRLAVGRERQRLLGMLQDAKPALKKVTQALKKLQQYATDYPGGTANWLSSEYVGASDSGELSVGRAVGSKVLCVGCGDGSYEMGAMLAGATDMTVSFYDSEVKAKQRYSNFAVNTAVLRALGATLLFEVDATDLGLTLQLAESPQPSASSSFSASSPAPAAVSYQQIVFNFPQTGNGFPGSESWHSDHAVLLRGKCIGQSHCSLRSRDRSLRLLAFAGFFCSICEAKLLLTDVAGISNDEFCITNDESCIANTNDEVCITHDELTDSDGSKPAEVWVTFMDRAPYCELALDDWAAESGLVRFGAEMRILHMLCNRNEDSCLKMTTLGRPGEAPHCGVLWRCVW